MKNEYIPFKAEICEIVQHTDLEYTYRLHYDGPLKPGQFFEVSIPKYGEAPISVSGIGDNTVDLTIRKVGRVTDEVFNRSEGDYLLIRGPYGNGFDVNDYKGKELTVVAGGTGISPVRALLNYFSDNPSECKGLNLVAGFKSPEEILFRNDFEIWRDSFNLILTVDRADDCYEGNIGLCTQFLCQLDIEDTANAVAIVVGPPMMMKFSIAGLLELGFKEENIWVSYERRMCCGVGKCGHCRINEVYVCTDGPVFNYSEAKHFAD